MEDWVNHFSFKNSFCPKAKAAIQAFKMTKNLDLKRVTFEENAQNMILAVQEMGKCEDWRVRKRIGNGRW